MIKLIACDLDGTLLDDRQHAVAESMDMIRAAMERGIEFLICTGRDYNMIFDILQDNQLSCDAVLNNGGQYRSADGRVNWYEPMPDEAAIRAIHILEDYGFHISMHTTAGKYTLLDLEEYYRQHLVLMEQVQHVRLEDYQDVPFFTREGYLRDCHSVGSVEELLSMGHRILKVDVRNADAKKAAEGLQKLQREGDLLVTSSYAQNMEINSRNCDKAYMLERVLADKGIKKEEAAVFGDSQNDYQMLKSFPNSFAMENAEDTIKAAAAHVTGTNLEGGVAEGIRMLLEKC